MISQPKPLISVIVIGLNEENLLSRSLQSVLASQLQSCDLEVIYVDSGSIDNSFNIAQSFHQVTALNLDNPKPSAAKARNFGVKKAKGDFIQFLDGDSILHENWLQTAYAHICNNDDVACVFGGLIESHPEANIYTHVCTFDWYIPPGEYRFCGGNSFWRKSFLDSAGYFDETLSAGEEPDLCYRVRQLGGRILCIDAPMVEHDLEMNTFQQYWQRGMTNGKAYAVIGLRYRHSKEKLWFKEMLRNFVEPLTWLIIIVSASYFFSFGIALIILCSLWFLRAVKIALNNKKRIHKLTDGLLYGFHLQFIRLPTFWGQLKMCTKYLKSR